MNINFTARHFRAPDVLRDYAEDGVARFEKYFDRINQCEIVMLHENSMFMTEINLHIPQHDVYAKSSSPNGFKSIEGCIDKISNQIVKIVDQWKKHR
jgi:ribosomal subunit interface protein|tara:strand:+ start:295 stop:585 length:291 start_codon:yes stop_codon:yes gene_type:complete